MVAARALITFVVSVSGSNGINDTCPLTTMACSIMGGQCAGGEHYEGPTCCAAGLKCETRKPIKVGTCVPEAIPTCAMLHEQCTGGFSFVGPATCCSPNQQCKFINSSSVVGVCEHVPSRPFSVMDLKRCSSLPDVEHDVPRRDCPKGTCELRTPVEFVNAGEFVAQRLRSDFINLHRFHFLNESTMAVITIENGRGYGGIGKLWELCYRLGAPGGCPDLRSIFHLRSIVNPFTGKRFDWSDPAQAHTAFLLFNNTLISKDCNSVGAELTSTIHLLDMCLDTELTDNNYWYINVQMDSQLAKECFLAPASCRLIKMGKAGGNDPTHWSESWDSYGSIWYNDEHIKMMNWASCPKTMADSDRTSCAFGSAPGASNCDSWWAPNTAPNKQTPATLWPPEPLRGQPDGEAVLAHFCGVGCEYVGHVPDLPLASQPESKYAAVAGEASGLQMAPNRSGGGACPATWCAECVAEGQQCGGDAWMGPTKCCGDKLTCENTDGPIDMVCVSPTSPAPGTNTLPPQQPSSQQRLKQPACAGNTVSVTIHGQPNVAVSFIDTDANTLYPVPLAQVHETATAALVAEVGLACSAQGVLQVQWANGSLFEPLAEASYRWDAAAHSGFRWLTIVRMVDIMFETRFDGEDALRGFFDVMVGNLFLEGKLGWQRGVSSFDDLVAAVAASKRATGRCPMLSPMYDRRKDLGWSFLSEPWKRLDYTYQAVMDDLDGVPSDFANHDFNQLKWVWQLQEKDDQMYLMRHFPNDVFLLWDQMTCLAPRYIFDTVPYGLQRAEGYQYETCRRVAMSEYGKQELRSYGREGRSHTGLHPSGGVESALYTVPPIQSAGDHRTFKMLLMSCMPPNTGFGTNGGKSPPPLSAKWGAMVARGMVNISHVMEMVFSLGTHWVSGLAVSEHTAHGVAQILHCRRNSGVNREMQMQSGGIPNDPYTRRFKHCESVHWANPNNGITGDLAGHYYLSPINDVIRKANAATAGNFLDTFSHSRLSATMTDNFAYLAVVLEVFSRKLLEDDDVKAQFRADPDRAVLELFRMGAPSEMSTTLDRTHLVNVSYLEQPSGANRFGTMHVGVGTLEKYSLYQANRDPSAFKRPNTFDAQRADWYKSLAFGAPLDIFFDINHTSGAAEYNMTKMLGVSMHGGGAGESPVSSRFFCAGFYVAKEISKRVIGAVLDSEEARYAADRNQCRDNDAEVMRMWGYPIYPEHSVCMNAMARIDARYEKGVGCKMWGALCCNTCQSFDADTAVYTQLVRMTMTRTMWFPDQFTWTGIATYRYFLATQRYWDVNSIVEVTPTGKSNSYKGPESILEYYSLQNEYFNPPSYRQSASVHNLSHRHFPMWDKAMDGRRIHMWNFAPAITLGRVQTGAEPPYDFSQFVWDDERSIFPIRRAFHDFRKPTADQNNDGVPTTMVDAFGGPDELCHVIMERCKGNYSQFVDFRDCYEHMMKLPMKKLGFCPLLAGDTLACRWTHAILSHEKMRPDVHCYHMGKASLADPDGKFKCHDSECGHDRQGPIVCDGLSCDGKYLHAGTFVDWMHVVFWISATLMATFSVLALMRRRSKLETAIDHVREVHASERLGEAVDLQLAHAGDTLDFLNKLHPVLVGCSVVFGFYALLFLVIAAAHPKFLYRPPPAVSLTPRFHELQTCSGEREARYWYSSGYAGQCSETLYSSMNLYMLGHMQFYVLLSGTLLFLLILEYIGTLLQELMPPRLKRVFCEVGNSAFVCFVSIALTLPVSSFSYILFCFGTTKMLYPQVHYTLWRAFEFGSETRSQWSESSTASTANAFLNKHKLASDLYSSVPSASIPIAEAPAVARDATDELRQAEAMNEEAEQSHRLNIHTEWSIGFFVHLSAGCGLMLHHFSLTMIFCAHCMHLLFTESIIFHNVLIGILILVLGQHLVGQVVPLVPLRALLLAFLEVIFQWFSISVMGDGGSSIGTVGTFGLMVSHMMMAPEVPFELFSSCSALRAKGAAEKAPAAAALASRAPAAAAPAAATPVEATQTVGV